MLDSWVSLRQTIPTATVMQWNLSGTRSFSSNYDAASYQERLLAINHCCCIICLKRGRRKAPGKSGRINNVLSDLRNRKHRIGTYMITKTKTKNDDAWTPAIFPINRRILVHFQNQNNGSVKKKRDFFMLNIEDIWWKNYWMHNRIISPIHCRSNYSQYKSLNF